MLAPLECEALLVLDVLYESIFLESLRYLLGAATVPLRRARRALLCAPRNAACYVAQDDLALGN